MKYELELQNAVVHSGTQCPTLAGQDRELIPLTRVANLTEALKVASNHVNRDGSVPPTSISTCTVCN